MQEESLLEESCYRGHAQASPLSRRPEWLIVALLHHRTEGARPRNVVQSLAASWQEGKEGRKVSLRKDFLTLLPQTHFCVLCVAHTHSQKPRRDPGVPSTATGNLFQGHLCGLNSLPASPSRGAASVRGCHCLYQDTRWWRYSPQYKLERVKGRRLLVEFGSSKNIFQISQVFKILHLQVNIQVSGSHWEI